jgi:hypothetical protein
MKPNNSGKYEREHQLLINMSESIRRGFSDNDGNREVSSRDRDIKVESKPSFVMGHTRKEREVLRSTSLDLRQLEKME